MDLVEHVKTLVNDIQEDFADYRVIAQVKRFIGTYTAALVLQITGGSAVVGWDWLWSAVAAGAWVLWRHFRPVIGWDRIQRDLGSMIYEIETQVLFRRAQQPRAGHVRTPTLRIPVAPTPTPDQEDKP